MVRGGRQRQRRRIEHACLFEQRLAFREIEPGAADVAAGGDRLHDLDRRRVERRAFSWMRIVSAPSGTGAPVKMRTASPLPTVPANGVAGRRFADDRQACAARRRSRGAHRVAVHRRGGEGRLRAQRLHRLGQHAAGRPRPAPRSRRRRPGVGEQPAAALRRPAAAPSPSAFRGAGSRRTCRRVFSTSRMPEITMPRSTALAMS